VREIGVGLVGLGHVGAGAVRILREQLPEISRRLGATPVIRRIAVRDPARAREVEVDPALLTPRIEDVLDDPDVEIVCELAGGVDLGRRVIEGALSRGKHVVTANKAVLAEHGEALFRLARERILEFHYEGSVCGGVPILRTLREALVSDRIEALYGIVNGTTNYLLARLDGGASFAEALADAQRLGLAEADPSLDVGGGDAAQKLCLLAGLAFGARLRPGDVATSGIAGLGPEDLAAARSLGFAVKLLAVARRTPGGLEARVGPTMIPRDSALAGVAGADNAVLLVSRALGASLLVGPGAGGLPTGVSVVADIVDLCRNLLAGSPGRVPLPCEPWVRPVPLLPSDEASGAFYLRFGVADRPGVLARLAGILGEAGISIAAVEQRDAHAAGGRPVPVMMVTHRTRVGAVRRALAAVERLPENRAPVRCVRIETPGRDT
jgi:homoserine dehydrogenase